MRRLLTSLVSLMVLVAALSAPKVASGTEKTAPLPEATTWYWTHPLPNGDPVRDLVFGEGVYLAVSEYGTIMRSVDGEHWTTVHKGTDGALTAIAYGQGRFVAVGTDGVTLTSVNGDVWESALVKPSSVWRTTFAAVAYGAGHFVVVDTNGAIFASTDGRAWSEVYTRLPVDWRGVEFNGDTFVAVGERYIGDYPKLSLEATVSFSSDGIHWTDSVPHLSLGKVGGLSYANGQFIIGGPGTIATSPDGRIWREREVAHVDSWYMPVFHSAAYGNGRWVIVGSLARDSSLLTLYSSADGVSWTEEDGFSAVQLGRIRYYDGRFIMAGSPILTSRDGHLWWSVSPAGTVTVETLNAVGFGDGLFAAAGAAGGVMTSPDGICWNYRDLGDYHWTTLAIGAGKIVVGDPAQIRTAVWNATTGWTISDYTALHPSKIVYGGGLFVALDTTKGRALFSSTDGLSWTERWRDPDSSILALGYANGQFRAMGAAVDNRGKRVLRAGTSADGVTWRWQDSPLPPDLSVEPGLFWQDGAYLMVGSTIASSRDGTDWERSPAYYSVVEGTVVSGKVSTITKHREYEVIQPGTWETIRTERLPLVPKSIAYGKGRYVIVGENGAIIANGSSSPTEQAETRFTAGCALYSQGGAPHPMPTYALQREGQLMVPAESLVAALGISAENAILDAQHQSAQLRLGTRSVTLKANVAQMRVDGKTVELTVSPFSGYGHLYLPAEAVARALGYRISNSPDQRTVVIIH